MKKLVIASSRRYGQKVKNLGQVMFSLLDPRGFRASFTRVMWLALMLATGLKVGRVTARSRRYNHILQLAIRVARHHGVGVAIKWLKACHVALMRAVGGSPLSSLRKVEKGLPFYRLSNGLPTCIGTQDRSAIRRGDPNVIRMYMTIFGTYRILSAPLNPKLNTISDPCLAEEEAVSEFIKFSERMITTFTEAFRLRWWLRPSNGRVPFSTSAGPNVSKGMFGYLADSRVVWYSHLRDPMIRYAQLAGLSKFVGWLRLCVTTADQLGPLGMPLKRSAATSFTGELVEGVNAFLVPDLGEEVELQPHATRPATQQELSPLNKERLRVAKRSGKKFVEITPDEREYYLGKPMYVQGVLGQLSFKVEAAGKLRVFAIVDSWTQWLLSGLHESIMSNLAKIPMDGTADHSACAVRAGLKGKEMGAWSVDISSATDRIPISIQQGLLGAIFTKELGDLWGRILTDRSFLIPENDHGVARGFIRYNAGQPMGARSSWPMLALTHHMLVQWAAECAGVLEGGNFFEDYEVIGDDLVIHNHAVYLKYLENAKRLDYGISEAKSLPSPIVGAVEMAKKVMLGDVSVSSVALKQLLSSLRVLSGRVQNVLYFGRLGLVTSPSTILAILARSKEDYLRSLQNYSVGKANSLICLLTAALGADRLAESVEFVAEPAKSRGTGKLPVQSILLFCEKLVSKGDSQLEPEFHSVLNAQNIVHALVHSILKQVRRRLAIMDENQGSYLRKFAEGQLGNLAPGRVYTKVATLQLLPFADFVLGVQQSLPELEEKVVAFEAELDEWALLPATAVLPRMVSLPRVRKISALMLAKALELLDETIALENRFNCNVEPRSFVKETGWLLGVLAPLARAQKAARTAVNIAGRPRSRFIGTW